MSTIKLHIKKDYLPPQPSQSYYRDRKFYKGGVCIHFMKNVLALLVLLTLIAGSLHFPVERVTAMDITDLERDSLYDYVFGCHKIVSDPWDRGAIYVYEDNQLQWYYHLTRVIKALTCYDLDFNRKEEVIMACDVLVGKEGDLYVFDHKGRFKWRQHIPGSPRHLYCYKNFVGVNVYGEGDRVLIFDHTGRKIKDLPVNGSISKFIIEDINKDGEYELVTAGTLDKKWKHFLVVYDLNGNVLWNFETWEHINDFQFHDIDADGIKEAVLVSYDSLYAIKGGTVLGRIYLPPGLLHVHIIKSKEQILVLNRNTMFLIDFFTVLNLQGHTVPLKDFSQVVNSHLRIDTRPEFFFYMDIDYDLKKEIITGNGETLEVHTLDEFVLGVEGFITVPVEEVEEKVTEIFVVYQNRRYGISIEHPEKWMINEPGTDVIVVFLSQLESPWDTFQENVNIMVRELAGPMTLEEYTDVALALLRQDLPDFTLIESSDFTLSTLPARKVVYTTKIEQIPLQVMQVWTIKDDTVYTVTYTAAASQYFLYRDIVDKMVASFEIAEKVSTVVICEIQFDAPGDDADNLNEEWVKICNYGDTDVDLSGWGLEDSVGNFYEFPEGFVLTAGGSVYVYTGSGENTDTALYWGRSMEVWTNTGDTATLTDNQGVLIDEYEWVPQ